MKRSSPEQLSWWHTWVSCRFATVGVADDRKSSQLLVKPIQSLMKIYAVMNWYNMWCMSSYRTICLTCYRSRILCEASFWWFLRGGIQFEIRTLFLFQFCKVAVASWTVFPEYRYCFIMFRTWDRPSFGGGRVRDLDFLKRRNYDGKELRSIKWTDIGLGGLILSSDIYF